jgi:hypothetical protein
MNKFLKKIASLSVILSSALLVCGANTANAAAPAASSAPATVTMQQLDERVATVPNLAGLKAGAPVVISDDGSVTGATWSGAYTYYPAGSVIKLAAGYVRWKDGLVAITPSPADADGNLPDTFDASYVTNDPNINADASSQVIRTLITDSSDPNVLRIPNNAWLFRTNGNGTVTTLVDAFILQSGAQPLYPQKQTDGTTLMVAEGSQPVPVAANFWQAQ